MAKESKVSRITKLVDHAVAMQAVLKDAQAKLDEAKAELRKLATDEFTAEQTKIVYAGSTGVAEVVYVGDKAKIAKGANPKSLLWQGGDEEPIISREQWETLFVEEVKLAADFQDRLKHFPGDTRRAVMKLVTVEAQEPRVSIR